MGLPWRRGRDEVPPLELVVKTFGTTPKRVINIGSSCMRTLRLVCVIAALIAAIWYGLKEGYDSWTGVETTGQRVAAICQLIYGVGAVASLWALLAQATWAPLAFALWGLAVTITATLAPVVWGGTPWSTGVLAGLSALVIVGVVTWGARAHLRGAASDSRPADR
jgi:cellulose synthase/poly-beta-1,6-N-acetylglucosamine synthase-like glycosyltransferase